MSRGGVAAAVPRAVGAVRARFDVALLVLLAYVPTLASSPGRMPSDTKLYLYLDPARLVSDAPYSWDVRQFGGWVPHQTISYLWPSGPWYALMDALGSPVWVAHRLWLGSVLLAGGLGARWLGRRLGLSVGGALVAGLVYQLSPFVLPYVSRTSLMLLPWAGLGWLIGLTMAAARRGGWRHPAIIALVLATVGAPNATAILMVAPGPVLWLVHDTIDGRITWRRAMATAARIGALAILTALWWMSMFAVQGRYGADVLGYSESLEAVSATARAPETIRGMGYWLAYVRDAFAPTTTAALDYMSSVWLILTGFALVTIGFAGIALSRWAHRRFAALLVLAGTILAVGVYPIDDPSPLMSALASNSRSAAALALRSSTRALPLSTLGLALGAGALVVALADRLRARSHSAEWHAAVPAAIVGALAIANLPILWTAGFVDPALARDQDVPSAWSDAAAALDALPSGYRVLQLPGTEFGAYRWGYTVDPPLPGLTERPLVTRDLLPLGTPALMDVLFAVDDRFQEGTIEPTAIAPLARLLGADTVFVTGDVAFERFRTPRPEQTAALYADAPGLGPTTAFGPPVVNEPDVPMLDEAALADASIGTAVAPVELVSVEDPLPIVRVGADTVVVAGSGDGIVDAAAAGLIDGSEVLRASASIDPDDLGDAIREASGVIVTDSNRLRAHQWRGTQDVVGFTEDDDRGTPDLLREDPADQRLPVFAEPVPESETVAVQRGPVVARATAYGEPFSYRPEHRAAMAVDGDLATAWVVADRADPTRDAIEITANEPIDALTLVQPLDPTTNRWITRLDVFVDGAGPFPVELSEASRTEAGERLALPVTGRVVRLAITAIGEDLARLPNGPDAVGFAEIDAGLGPTEEIVVLPSDVLRIDDGTSPLSLVMTRLRTRPTNRWRSDPEPALHRAFTLAAERSFDATLTARLSARADDAVLADLLGVTGPLASRRLTGVPSAAGWAAADGDAETAWTSPFGKAVGSSLSLPVESVAAGTTLVLHQPLDGTRALIAEVELSPDPDVSGGAGEAIRLAVPPPDADGRSALTVPAPISGPLWLTVTATDDATTRDRRYGELTPLPVSITEIELDGLTRSQVPDSFDTGCRDDLVSVDGSPLDVRVTGSVDDLLTNRELTVATCGAPSLDMGLGEHTVRTTPGRSTGIDIDRVVLQSPQPDASAGQGAGAGSGAGADAETPDDMPVQLESTRTTRTVTVGACPDGCWLVFGEGYSTGWRAELDGAEMSPHEQLAGGLNGWWLPPSSAQERTVTITWTPQRTVTIGLAMSAAGVLLCIGIIVASRRRRTVELIADRPRLVGGLGRPDRRWVAAVGAVGALVLAPLVIGPGTLLPVLAIVAVCCGLLRRSRLLAMAGTALVAGCGVLIARREVLYHLPPGFDWLPTVADYHQPVLIAVVLLTAGSLARDAGSTDDGVPSGRRG